MTEPLTTARALHLFRKELEALGYPDHLLNELLTYAGKCLVDGSADLTVRTDV